MNFTFSTIVCRREYLLEWIRLKGYCDIRDTNSPFMKKRLYAFVLFSFLSVSLGFGQSIPTNGLTTWLKADNGVVANGQGDVSQWSDQSGNGNHAVQGTAANQPILSSSNGTPSLYFNSYLSTFLSLPRSVQDDFTAVVVFDTTQTGYGETEWWASSGILTAQGAGGTDAFGVSIDGTGKVFTGVGNPNTDIISPTAFNDGKPHQILLERTKSTGVFNQYVDTVLQGSATSGTDSITAPSNILLGLTPDMQAYFSGNLKEVILYNRTLTSDEKTQLNNYLANKYGFYSVGASWISSYSTAMQTVINQFQLTQPQANQYNWITTYSSSVQGEILKHQWNQTQANNYVAAQAANPTLVTFGLAMWFKADAGITQDGNNNVTSWIDQISGYQVGGYSPTGTTSNPSYVSSVSTLNNKPVVRYNGGQFLANTAQVDAGFDRALTIITVTDTTNPSAYEYSVFIGGLEGGDGRGMGYSYNQQTSSYYEASDYYWEQILGAPAPSANTYTIDASTLTADLSSATLYLNGTANGSGSLSGIHNPTPGMFLGGASDGPTWWRSGWQGDIAEVLVYDRVLSSAELSQVNVYLSAKYNLNVVPTTSVPTDSLAEGTYTSAQTVTLTASAGTTIYYTTDGTIPTINSTLYTGPINISQTTTLEYIAVAPGDLPSTVTSVTYTIQQNTTAPTFSLAGGSYIGAQDVTLTDTDTNATIYYTTDGTTPTTSSTIFSSPIPITQTTTLQAIAVSSGENPSSVVSATYTIVPPVPTNGLLTWLSADNGVVLNGSTVSQWNDQSGNNLNAVQATTANQPTAQMDPLTGIPVLTFDGASSYLTLPSGYSDFTQGNTIIIVAQPVSNSSNSTSTNSSLITNGTYEIVAQNSSLALAATGSTDGAPVVQQIYTGLPTQQWTLNNLGNNIVTLMSPGSSEALEVPNSSTTPGAPLDISTYTGGSNQQWTIVAASSGHYEIVNVQSGLEVNVAYNSSDPGMLICQWYAGDYPNGVWAFASADSSSTSGTLLDFGNGQSANNLTFGLSSNEAGLDTQIYSGSTPSSLATTSGLTQGSYQILETTQDPATGIVTQYVNGAALTPSAVLNLPANLARSSNYLGASATGAYFNGNIAEVLVYNRTLTATERQTVEKYVASKYNLTDSNGLSIAWELQYFGQTGIDPSVIAPNGLTYLQCSWFSLDPTSTNTMDSNGLSYAWEIEYFGQIGIDASQPSPAGDGLTTLQEYQQGRNPLDYYQGQTPVLLLVSGDQQIVPPGSYSSAPLVAKVTDSQGNLLVNAPVSFYVNDLGQLSTNDQTTAGSWVTVTTDANGLAQVYGYMPVDQAASFTVTAYAGPSGGTQAQVTYTISPQATTPTPTASLPQGIYASAQTVTLTTSAGTTIYYTTDGTTPTTSSSVYTAPLSITQTTTLQFFAIVGGDLPSSVTSVTYTIDPTTSGVARNGLLTWLRADTGVVAADTTVSQWNDQSGNTRNAVQATTDNEPTSQIDPITGIPVLTFDGAASYLTLPSGYSDFTQGNTIIIVGEPSATTGTVLDLGNGQSSDNLTFGLNANALGGLSTQVYSGSTASALNTTSGVAQGNYQILETTQDSATGIVTQYVNGTALTPSAVLNLPANLSRASNYLGTSASGTYYSGNIAEILVYNRALTETERHAVETYLAAKYYLTDNDDSGLPTAWELEYFGTTGLNPNTVAPNGLTYLQCYLYGLSPVSTQTLDSNGLSYAWEVQYFGQIGLNASSSLDGNGLTLLQDYQQGNDPTNYYSKNGTIITPVVTLVSGDQQTVSPDAFTSSPLVVLVKDASGNILSNAPVSFSVSPASAGFVATTTSSSASTTLSLTTDSNGLVQVYAKASNLSVNFNVTAIAGATGHQSSVSFNVLTQNSGTSWQQQDIGDVNYPGSGTYDSSTDEFTVLASGSDIWGAADAFHYVYQPFSGDGEIITYVDSTGNSNAWAKAGIMFRQSLDPASPFVMLALTPGGQLVFQLRSDAGDNDAQLTDIPVQGPEWLKLQRYGTIIYAWHSPDGVNWQSAGSLVVPFSDPLYAGLAFTSHDNTILGTALFKGTRVVSYSLDSDNNGLPDAWEIEYFGHTGVNPNALSPAGDGLTNLQEYQQGRNPLDYYQGQPPTLVILSGDQQLVSANKFSSSPLVVQVQDASGNLLVNAPVTFSVNGAGLISTTTQGSGSSTISLRTNSGGKAQVFAKMPIPAGIFSVAVTAGQASASFSVLPAQPATNDPTGVSGLKMWFKADAGVTADSSGNVSAWIDQTSSHYTVTQNTTGYQPALISNTLNGKPVLRLSGNQGLYNSAAANTGLNGGLTIITVGSVTDPSAHQYAAYLGNASSPGQTRALGFYQSWAYLDASGTGVYGEASPDANEYVIEAATLDAAHQNVAFYRNGTASASGSFAGASDLSTGLSLGNDSTGANGWTGDIAEVLVYDHQLGPEELAIVNLYLAGKYGLSTTVPSPVIYPKGEYFLTSPSIYFSGVGPEIRYTLDGSTPTAQSPLYTDPFTLAQDSLVSCAVFSNGVQLSPVATSWFYFGDADGNGLPDAWEENYFGQTGLDPNSLTTSGDGLTLLQAYQEGIDPVDFYGDGAVVTVVSGNDQSGAPGSYATAPLVVKVTNTRGMTQAGTTVTFQTSSGIGGVAANSGDISAATLTATTDTNGISQVYYQFPLNMGTVDYQVIASVDDYSATFTEWVTGTSTVSTDGAETVTLGNVTDGQTFTYGDALNLTTSLSNTSGVKGVMYQVDGSLWSGSSLTSTGGYATALSTILAPGTHTVTAYAFTSSGKVYSSTPISIQVTSSGSDQTSSSSGQTFRAMAGGTSSSVSVQQYWWDVNKDDDVWSFNVNIEGPSTFQNYTTMSNDPKGVGKDSPQVPYGGDVRYTLNWVAAQQNKVTDELEVDFSASPSAGMQWVPAKSNSPADTADSLDWDGNTPPKASQFGDKSYREWVFYVPDLGVLPNPNDNTTELPPDQKHSTGWIVTPQVKDSEGNTQPLTTRLKLHKMRGPSDAAGTRKGSYTLRSDNSKYLKLWKDAQGTQAVANGEKIDVSNGNIFIYAEYVPPTDDSTPPLSITVTEDFNDGKGDYPNFDSVVLYPVDITREVDGESTYKTINSKNKNDNLLPGQQVQLHLLNGSMASNVQWTIPDKSFKDWTANEQTAKLTQLEASDLNQQDVEFYWADSGSKDVSINFSWNGTPITLHKKLKCLKPVSKMSATVVGTISINSTSTFAGLYGKGDSNGMSYTGNVSLPSDYTGDTNGGGWNWVQTVRSTIYIRFTSGRNGVGTLNNQTVLDTDYPYAPYPLPTHYPLMSSNTDGDHPDTPLDNDMSRVFRFDDFQTYLMFLPPGGNSRYVPLQSANWYWYESLKKINSKTNKWSFTSKDADAYTPQDTPVHPVWNNNISNIEIYE